MAQRDLFRFNRDLKAFSDKLGIDVTTTVKKIGFDLFRRIVQKTPVDTGRARASWTIALAKPDRTVAAPGLHAEYQTDATGAAAQKANSVLASMKAGTYQPVWISNNLPYIEALEKGHSKQAAPGVMVALSIAETELELDTATGAIR